MSTKRLLFWDATLLKRLSEESDRNINQKRKEPNLKKYCKYIDQEKK
jgi:hypothetical protein